MEFKSGNEGSGIDSKHFVRLKDKEHITGVFRGNVHEFKQHWISKRSYLCTGEGCKHCVEGNKPSFRFRLNFIVKDANETYLAKIFEQGWTVYNQLKGLHSGDYPLEKNIVKITRFGTGTETQYTILPIANGAVTATREALLQSVTLHDLVDLSEPEKVTDNSSETDDIPF